MRSENAVTCEQFRELVWLFISGELDAPARRRWTVHLQSCEICARRLATTRKTVDAFATRPLQPEDGLRFDAMATAAASRPHRARSRSPRMRLSWRWSFVPMFAVALAALLIVRTPEESALQPTWHASEYVLKKRDLDSLFIKYDSIDSLMRPAAVVEEDGWQREVDEISRRLSDMEFVLAGSSP